MADGELHYPSPPDLVPGDQRGPDTRGRMWEVTEVLPPEPSGRTTVKYRTVPTVTGFDIDGRDARRMIKDARLSDA